MRKMKMKMKMKMKKETSQPPVQILDVCVLGFVEELVCKGENLENF
jgi:hypothetical protein